MKNVIVRRLTANAIVAALYFVLTFASSPIAFLGIQVRISEFLILLCFFNKDYIAGVTIGTLLANLLSPMLPWDLIFGTLATLIAATGVAFCRHLLIAAFIPAVVNGFIVAAELHIILEDPFWINVLFVACGEIIAVIGIGYTLFMILRKNKKFMEMIEAKQNLEFKW